MPVLEDQDQDQDQASFTPDDAGWLTSVGLNDPATGDNNPLVGKSADANTLKNAENSMTPRAGQDGATLAKEGASPGGGGGLDEASFTSGKTIGGLQANNGPMGRVQMVRAALSTRRGKAAGIGGIITTVVIAGFGFLAASSEIIHMRQQLLDNSPTGRIMQQSVTGRKVKAFNYLATKTSRYAKSKLLRPDKLDNAIAEAGLEAEKNSDNVVTAITSHGEDINEIASRGGTEALELGQNLDEAVKTTEQIYAGPSTRSLISGRFKGLRSWLKGTPKEGATPTETIADELDKADDAAEAATTTEGKALSEVSKGLSDEEKKAGATAHDATGGLAEDAASKGEKAAAGVAEEEAAKLANAIEESAAKYAGDIPIDKAVKELGEKVAKNSPGIFGKLAAGAGRGVSVTEPVRIACTAKGTIKFFSSIRNTVIAGLVAEGFVRFLTASDEAKEGVIKSSALNIFMVALHSNGGYAASGAFQSVTGNASARPSSGESALYSGARVATGFLGVLSRIVDQVPYLTSTNCKFAHNGLVIVAGAGVGAVVGIFTDGITTNVSITISIALTLVQIAVETIGVPLFGSYMQGQVSSAFKSKKNWGGTLGAGSSSFQASLGSGTALGATTKDDIVNIRDAAKIALQYKRSKQGIYDRYLNIASSDSLLGQLAFRSPKTPTGLKDSATNLTTAFANGIGSGGISMLGSLFARPAYAAENSDCGGDTQMTEHNLACDALDYPIIASMPAIDPLHAESALFKAGEIDKDGKIISEDYKNYIKNCFSGRPGLLYKENVNKDGEEDDKDNTCILPGDPLAGDYPEQVPAYAVLPAKSFWSKIFGQKAYAETPAISSVQYGINQIRQAYYASMIDMDAMTEIINEDYGTSGSGSIVPAAAANNPVQAPGLNGYTIPCTGLPNTPKTVGARPDTINWDSIPDSGTIGTASDGKPIKVFIREPCVSTNAKTVTVVSSIHGTENQGQPISFELLFKKTLPPNMRVIAIPELNHAGINNDPGRVNANGVNLNRNFDFNWSSADTGTDYSGPNADSEPETKAIKSFLTALADNSLLIVYHDNLHYIVGSSEASVPISKAYFNYATAHGITGFQNTGGKQEGAYVPQHGGLDSWYANAVKKPALLIEMSQSSTPTQSGIHADAIANLVSAGTL